MKGGGRASRWRLQLGLGLAACAVMARPAFAGAWLAEDGGVSINSAAVGRDGETVFGESQLYLEAPIAERAALVFRPWFRTGPNEGPNLYRSEMELSLKYVAPFHPAGASLALQAGPVWRSEPESECAETALALRAMAGRNFWGDRGFANVELGADLGAGAGCRRERFDVAFGYRPSPRYLALAETFVTTGEAIDSGVQAQLSLVRFSRSRRGVQVGVRSRIAGGAPQPALVVGFWTRAMPDRDEADDAP